MFGLFRKKDGQSKLPGPTGIPEIVGRYMVVDMKQESNYVWALKAVIRKIKRTEGYCRVFNDAQVAQAGVQVKDWNSLDGHPELILWEGYFNQETNVARPEKVTSES